MRRTVLLVAAAVVLAVFGTITVRWYTSPDRMSIHSMVDRTRIMLAARLSRSADAAVIGVARERAQSDDWTTFAHDDKRSGFERLPTGITRATAPRLGRRWMRSLHEPVRSSPIVSGGNVYVETDQGSVYALDAASGEVRWHRQIGNAVRMTPALVDGALLVGVYGALGNVGAKPHGAAFVSLDAQTGDVRWRTELPGLVRAEPVVLGGVIYEGLAGGDSFSGCFDGRVIALDERTGALLPQTFRTSARRDNGGGVWGPLSTDGSTIYVGTGNTCAEQGASDYGDSIVALKPDLHLAWHTSANVPGVDDSDVGGGVALHGDKAFVAGKSGFLYELERASGKILSRRDLAPWARNGGSIGTPTGDGTVLVVSGGEKTDPAKPPNPGCVITGFDLQGKVLYRFRAERPVTGYAAFVPGVGFMTIDRRLVGFDAASGAELWAAELGDYAYASPVVVPSGVYAANDVGDVFAFGLPASAAQQ